MKQAAIQLLQDDCSRVIQEHIADLDLPRRHQRRRNQQ